MKKGQFSVEFIIVLGALLTIIATTSIPLYKNSRVTAEKLSSTIKTREAANKLALSLNSAYSGSVSTSNPATYWLPRNVTEINEVSINNELNVKITLKQNGEKIEIKVPTLLPGSWKDRVSLKNIKLDPDNRVRHRTEMTLLEGGINVSDKILERE